jgi:endogenous inhibitor of DNA gyrase (YacG/DUF329 family)
MSSEPAKMTKCPTCRKPTAAQLASGPNKVYPFCSSRCQLIDLGAWLGEEFRVPGEPDMSSAAEEDS